MHGTLGQLKELSPWLSYKRMSDNVPVKARLVMAGEEKLMEVDENRLNSLTCPTCRRLLAQRNASAFPNFLFEPTVFHSLHRPIEKKA